MKKKKTKKISTIWNTHLMWHLATFKRNECVRFAKCLFRSLFASRCRQKSIVWSNSIEMEHWTAYAATNTEHIEYHLSFMLIRLKYWLHLTSLHAINNAWKFANHYYDWTLNVERHMIPSPETFCCIKAFNYMIILISIVNCKDNYIVEMNNNNNNKKKWFLMVNNVTCSHCKCLLKTTAASKCKRKFSWNKNIGCFNCITFHVPDLFFFVVAHTYAHITHSPVFADNELKASAHK